MGIYTENQKKIKLRASFKLVSGLFSYAQLCLLLFATFLISAHSVHAECNANEYLNRDYWVEQQAPNFKSVFLTPFTRSHPELRFREATPADVPALQTLINTVRAEFIDQGETLENVFDDDLTLFHANFSNSQSTLMIISDPSGKILGSGGFARTGENEVELRKIYFDPSLRGNRLGYAWVESLVKLAKDLGNERIWLVNHHNLAQATSIYRGIGFTDFNPSYSLTKKLPLSDYWFLDLNLKTWTPAK